MALVLIILAAVAAIVALESRNLLVGLGAAVVIGLLLIVTCLYVRAFDVAVVLIVAVAVPVWILAKRAVGLKVAPADVRDLPGVVVAVALLVILFVVSLKALGGLPKFGEPVFGSIAGSPGMVYGGAIASVFFRYRLFDILACAVVLLAGLVCSMSAVPKRAGRPVGESGEKA